METNTERMEQAVMKDPPPGHEEADFILVVVVRVVAAAVAVEEPLPIVCGHLTIGEYSVLLDHRNRTLIRNERSTSEVGLLHRLALER